MTKVSRLLELYEYKTVVKIEPCINYCNGVTGSWFNTCENLLDNYEDVLSTVFVELIEHKSQYDVIYYSNK